MLLPRTGGVWSPPAGTKGTVGTTIQSSRYNALVDDLTSDANDARPVTAGGTGANNATAARAALGLTIGTNVQAYDALLQSIAGLTTAANQIIYTTGADVAAVTTITAYGRSLIDDADAAAARATLGLGTIATQASSNVSITGGSVSGIVDIAIADGGTGASSASAARTNLGLGTAATSNTGTSGGTVPLLNANNTWSGTNSFTGATTFPGASTFSGTNTFTGNPVISNSAPFLRFQDTDSGTYDAQWVLNSNNIYLQGSPNGSTYATKIQFELDTNNVYFGSGSGNILIWNGTAVPLNVGGTGATTAANARANLGINTALIGSLYAGLGSNTVGSYILARNTASTALTPGDTIAGSSLRATSVGGNDSDTMSGTWRCMGYTQSGASGSGATTVFLKIS